MLRNVIVVIAACGLVLGCGNDHSTLPSADTPGTGLRLDFTALPPLQGGFHYEGWAIIEGRPFSTGKFNVGQDGRLVAVGGTTLSGDRFQTNVDVRAASAVVITIEPAGDNDAVPAATKILAGSFSSPTANLDVGTAQALGNDFAQARGLFILATPTNGDGTNETSGIWFLDPRSGSPTAGLVLPALPQGWEYEGWTVIDGIPVTTGRFRTASGADQSAPFSGPLPGPPFPGEDFLVNAPAGLSFPRDLAGQTAVITIEPSPDDSAAPFGLKPLIGDIPAPSQDHVVFSMANRAADLPRGTATVE